MHSCSDVNRHEICRTCSGAFGRALRDGETCLPADGCPGRSASTSTSIATMRGSSSPLRSSGPSRWCRTRRRGVLPPTGPGVPDTCPSRQGDLHWVGSDYPAWLAVRMAASGYEWLADLAALEWAVASATVSPAPPSIPITALAGLRPSRDGAPRMRFQPSLRMIDSPYPSGPYGSPTRATMTRQYRPTSRRAASIASSPVSRTAVVYRLDTPDYRLTERLVAGECSATPSLLSADRRRVH